MPRNSLKLTDTHLVILGAAAQRDNRAALPLPKSCKTNKDAAAPVFRALIRKGLLKEQPVTAGGKYWRQNNTGDHMGLFITDKGLNALGLDPAEAPTAPSTAAKGKPVAGPLNRSQKASEGCTNPSTTAGSKRVILVDLLRRKRGATIDEMAEATGWQTHSVRGAISGTIRKKLGLDVQSEAIKGRGRVYRIAGWA